MKGYVYILECSDRTYYTGTAKDVGQRLHQHQNKKGAKYTRGRLPVKLVYTEGFEHYNQALRREKEIQGWSRAQKQELIDGGMGGAKCL